MYKKKNILPLSLQFFAEGDSGADGASGTDGTNVDDKTANTDATKTGDDGATDGVKDTTKTFTQEELSAIAAREKKEGKKAVLSALGFKSEDEAKKALENYNAFIALTKTDAEKKADENAKLVEELAETKKKASEAETKLIIVNAGVNKESIEDVIAIATLKISDTKSLEDVIADMKKQEKYNVFFNANNSANGTGNPAGNNKGTSTSKASDYGKLLATGGKVATGSEKKSTYFGKN